MPENDQAVWGAITRAVRLPSLFERSADLTVSRLPGGDGNPVSVVLYGRENLDPEYSTSYEIGYRAYPSRALSFDVTAFVNKLFGLTETEANAPRADTSGRTIMPRVYSNDVNGHTRGFEALLTIRPTDRLDITTGYTYWAHSIRDKVGDPEEQFAHNDVPHHQAQLRSYLTLTSALELDAAIYYVGNIPLQKVPSYVRTDIRLGWQFNPHLELSLSGRNLTNAGHVEFNGPDENTALAPVRRSISGTVTWRQ